MKIIIATAITLLSTSATAQTMCGPREKIVDRLQTKFSEHQASFGVTSAGTVIEVFESKEKGTWTLLHTRPDGVSCFVASGEAWQDIKPDKGTEY